jgi:hypothetical protein
MRNTETTIVTESKTQHPSKAHHTVSKLRSTKTRRVMATFVYDHTDVASVERYELEVSDLAIMNGWLLV